MHGSSPTHADAHVRSRAHTNTESQAHQVGVLQHCRHVAGVWGEGEGGHRALVVQDGQGRAVRQPVQPHHRRVARTRKHRLHHRSERC